MKRAARWVGVLALVTACWGDDAYIVEGVVVEVNSSTEVVVDHQAIDGYMPAMVMPFRIADSSAELKPGDQIVARLRTEGGLRLERVRVVGHTPRPPVTLGTPVRPGQVLESVSLPVTGGESWTLGRGQGVPTAVTFLYTTCPVPEYCPLVVTRMQGLQERIAGKARILAVTIDPAGDTLPVLDAFAASVGARPDTWRFGRLEGEAFRELVGSASLAVLSEGDEVVHGLRLMVLDANGKLIERYDDNAWPLDRVVQQLSTGGPPAPPGSDGTMSRPPTPTR